MGRRPVSPELQAARGNPGKRPIKKGAARAVIERIQLQRPKWLSDRLARQVWGQLAPSLHFLRQTDAQVFGRYCVYLSDWVTANKEIKASGGAVYVTSSQHVENMLRINPWFTVRSRLEDDLVKLEEKLGLTPLDRQKIMRDLAAAAQMPASDLFGGRGGDEGDGDDESPDVSAPTEPADAISTIGGLGGGRLN